MPDLVLRAPDDGDAAALNALVNLPGVRAGTLRLPFTPLAQTKRRLFDDNPNRHSILAEEDGRVLGLCTLMRGTGRQSHTGWVGIMVHDDHVGRGIGTALLKAALDLADNWLGLTRLQLEVYPDNVAAVRLYERAGFEREGLLRANALRDGQLTDSIVMGRLRPAPAGPDGRHGDVPRREGAP